jgi:hypothetical protein
VNVVARPSEPIARSFSAPKAVKRSTPTRKGSSGSWRELAVDRRVSEERIGLTGHLRSLLQHTPSSRMAAA